MLNEDLQKKSLKAVKRAIAIAGNASQLSKMLKITRSAVSAWDHGVKLISVENAYKVEAVTKGLVKVRDLRPDLTSFEEKVKKKS